MQALINKIETATTEQVKEMAQQLVDDMRDGADEVFGACLTVLETRMTEDDYVAFCEAL